MSEIRRVLRGGSFDSGRARVRCACRYWYGPDDLYGVRGFRPVLAPIGNGQKEKRSTVTNNPQRGGSFIGSHLCSRSAYHVVRDYLDNDRMNDDGFRVTYVEQNRKRSTMTNEPQVNIEWCNIPAGPFLMGSTDEDEMAWDDEKPQRTITLEEYRIGKFPITNEQYAAFVEAGGYGERRYWTDAGWERRGIDGWTGPHDYGLPYTLPNHPVVGVSWYEATAFCCWLTEHLREIGELSSDEEVSLPTEEQWEKAARGTDGRIYPWGDEPDPTKANYSDTKIGATSAVGSFPSGASPYGVEDMSGNVWEWCKTEWKSYE